MAAAQGAAMRSSTTASSDTRVDGVYVKCTPSRCSRNHGTSILFLFFLSRRRDHPSSPSMLAPRFGSPGRATPRFMPITKRVGRASISLIILALTSLFLTRHLFSRQHHQRLLFPLASYIPQPNTTSAFHPVSLPSNITAADLCASFPSHLITSRSIQPVLKMGHGENPSQIAAQLSTVSSCFAPEDLLIFSDLDQDLVVGHHAIDILAYLPPAYHDGNPDLDSYRALRALLEDGGEIEKDQDPTAKTGWKTDKYKFLLLIERAWTLKPGREWYVFYETDTYLVWDNVFRLLSLLDPAKPVYLGSPSPGREGTFFANGGPGFVLSRAAMESLLSWGEESLAMRGMEMVKGDCCGDSVLGWMLFEAGVGVSGLFPMFSPWAGEGTPYTQRAWCQPVVSLHKTGAAGVEGLWRWEGERGRGGVSSINSRRDGFRVRFADDDGG